MKTLVFLLSRVSLSIRFVIYILFLVMAMSSCGNPESLSEVTPAPPPEPSDPIEKLADDMMQDPTFLAILEQQAWMNNQVEQYLFAASETDRTAAVSIIQSWQEEAHMFGTEDWNIAREVLGFPDLESFEQYQAEMGQRLKAFAESYAGVRLSPQEAKRLAGYLADRVLTDFPKPKGFESLEELEFRIADCCCANPNSCSTLLCNQIDACHRDATSTFFSWFVAGAGLGGTLGSSVPGPGTGFGMAVGGGLVRLVRNSTAYFTLGRPGFTGFLRLVISETLH